MRQVAGRLRLDLAQYRELEAFAQFAAELDTATQKQLARGERMVEVLKQGQYQPLPVEHQVMIIYAGTNGHLDDVEVTEIREWEAGFHSFVRASHAEVGKAIRAEGLISEATEERLKKAIEEFKEQFFASKRREMAAPAATG
jgi:F-type H+-transporting ATPase subunit alpha